MDIDRLLQVFESSGYDRGIGHTTYHIHEVLQLVEIGDADIVYLSYDSGSTEVAHWYMREAVSWCKRLDVPHRILRPGQIEINGINVHFMTYERYTGQGNLGPAWRDGRKPHYLIKNF